VNGRSLPIALGLVLVALVAVIAAGPLGLGGGSAGPTAGPTSATGPQGSARTGTVPDGSPGVAAAPPADGSATAEPGETPGPNVPAEIADVAIVPVTSFRAIQTATSRKELLAVLDGSNDRYTALELVRGEADAIFAALDVERPGDPSRLVLAHDAADLATDLSKNRKRLAFLRADAVGPDVRALDWGDKALFGVDRVMKLAAWPLIARLPAAAPGDAYDPATTWTLFAGGDIMLDRGVYETLEVKGKGADYPFDGGTAEITDHAAYISSFGWPVPSTRRTGNAGAVRDLISGADIAAANFENPAPNNHSWHTSGTVFSADPALIDGLAEAGFDYVSLANNHIRDAGATGLLQTIRNVKKRGIAVSGAGRDLAAARKPAILEAGGVKVAILGYDAIAGYYHATPDKVGSAPLTARNVKVDVKAARSAGADLVIVYPHWGTEYDRTPFASQQRLAEMIIDNGADMVIGNHAHYAAAMEIYKGKPIWYALGNFVFDQTWSEPTMEGITLELTFRGSTLVQVHMRPHIILDKAQPNFLDPAGDGKVVMGQVYMASRGLLPW
jgi:poly-gamma-glutamate capsule biosynthesis protein CapA/YwtB (metallophosphatase superfamily)